MVPAVNEQLLPPQDMVFPRDLGYAMPAEWKRHAATWLAWPHNVEDWPGKFEPIPWIYADIVRLIAQGEKVYLLIPPSRRNGEARKMHDILERAGADLNHVELIPQPTDRIWTRDSGPIFVTPKAAGRRHGSGSPVLIDFKFNAWAKYDNSQHDDRLPAVAAQRLHARAFTAYGLNDRGEYQRFVLEGGSIDVNGAGCVLTTEECLLSKVQQRNPGFSREGIENTLAAYLGVEKVLWLERGIAGDDTHGHIDDTARFVNDQTVLLCVEKNKGDENYAPMQNNLKRLKKFTDARGRRLNVVELPLPAPVYFDGQRLPASYANFYICNAGVLVPVFNDPHDVEALRVIETCFTDRPIIPVYCRDLVWGLGTLHCMTQQQPAV